DVVGPGAHERKVVRQGQCPQAAMAVGKGHVLGQVAGEVRRQRGASAVPNDVNVGAVHVCLKQNIDDVFHRGSLEPRDSISQFLQVQVASGQSAVHHGHFLPVFS